MRRIALLLLGMASCTAPNPGFYSSSDAQLTGQTSSGSTGAPTTGGPTSGGPTSGDPTSGTSTTGGPTSDTTLGVATSDTSSGATTDNASASTTAASGSSSGDPPCDDNDGDGLCNDADNCPDKENPDQADGDADGVGDLCDVCGAPKEYPPMVGPSMEILIKDVSIDGGGSYAHVAPGATFTVNFAWKVNFCECESCVTQGMIGLADHPPGKCFYDKGSLANCAFWMDTAEHTFVAPMEPGVYPLRTSRTYEFGCKPENFAGDPAGEFAAICVK